jgi:hydrogenase maturation protease
VRTQILVAGVGNVFFRDDGFGPAVAAMLLERGPLDDQVRITDYGIRGTHLSYDLLDGVDSLVLIDAVPAGAAPGTVTVLAVDPDDVGPAATTGLDAHAMAPVAVLAGVSALGGTLPRTYLVGCVPADLAAGMGLSDPVAAAVPAAADAVTALVRDLLGERAALTASDGTG